MEDLKDSATQEEVRRFDDLHEYQTNEGYIIDADNATYGDLKVARDMSYAHPIPSMTTIASLASTIPYTLTRFEPEVRLRVIWISTPFMVAGLVLLGFCLEDAYHYMVTSFAWGIYVFGIMITTVAVTAYNLDSYPEGSGEVAAWINFSRTLGGFIISYFQVKWASSMGTKNSFGIQAGICVFAFMLIVGLQLFGKRLRVWGGKLNFHTS